MNYPLTQKGLRRLATDRRGATAAEYALMLVAILVVVTTAYRALAMKTAEATAAGDRVLSGEDAVVATRDARDAPGGGAESPSAAVEGVFNDRKLTPVPTGPTRVVVTSDGSRELIPWSDKVDAPAQSWLIAHDHELESLFGAKDARRYRDAYANGQSVERHPDFHVRPIPAGSYEVVSGHGKIEKGASFQVPSGTRVIFLAPPGATISDRLGQIADTKGDLSHVPTLTMEGGARSPDVRIYPGTGLNIQGTPIQVTDPNGKLLSEVIRENHLEGKDVVVSTCFQSDKGPWRGIVIKRPEDYR